MRTRRLAALVAIVGVLAGCATSQSRPPAAEVPQVAPTPPPPVVTPTPEPPRQADALARIASELTELQNAVAKLMLSSRQQEDQLVYLQRRLAELEAQARNRTPPAVPGFATGPPPSPLPPPPVAMPPSPAPAAPPPSAAVRPEPAPAPAPPIGQASSGEELFQAGLAKYQAGDLDGAVVTLYEVVANYPSEPARERAQFLIGDIFYEQKDYRGAVAELEGLIKAVPSGGRVPEALLKLGMAQRSLGDETQARRVWQRLVKDYPNTAAARQARTLLRASKG